MDLADLPDSFRARVAINQNSGCWEWVNPRSDGYGRFYLNRKQVLAHRFAYQALVGEVETGLDLDHLCRNRKCCNPEHLEPVTRRENCRRSPIMGKWKLATTHCPEGHEYNSDNTYTDKRGKRNCRACGRQAQREYRERQALKSGAARG